MLSLQHCSAACSKPKAHTADSLINVYITSQSPTWHHVFTPIVPWNGTSRCYNTLQPEGAHLRRAVITVSSS